ncbi:MAG: hypothetical protein IPQ08_09850 [Chitinophagaceae bacterium]|nr:hypothetical protein [Chitinophagaceae bacterium]
MHPDQKQRKCKLVFFLLLSPLFFYGQSLTGLWSGTLSNDSNTVRKDQLFEIALTEYRGKVYGYSRSEFIVNDTLYYILKRVKGTIEGDICEVTDYEIIAYNFRGKLDKGIRVTSTFRRSKADSTWHLDGSWKTNANKKYYSITGKIGLAEDRDLAHSKIFPHLEELQMADKVAFYKEQKETVPVAMRRVKPELVNTEYSIKPEIEIAPAGKVELDKTSLNKSISALEERIAAAKKEEEERIKQARLEEENKQKQLEEEKTRLAALEQEKIKAAAADEQKRLLAKQEEEKKAIQIEEEKKKLAQLEEEKKEEQKRILARLEEEKKTAKEQEEKRRLAQVEEEKKKATQIEEERKRLAKLEEDRKKYIAQEEEKKKIAQEEQKKKLAQLEEEKKKAKDLAVSLVDPHTSAPLAKQEDKKIPLIPVPTGATVVKSTKKIDDLIQQNRMIGGRISEFSQEVLFKSDSLELSLYDNGEIDGDTVSVYINGELTMAKQGLKASAIKKTIYIQPGDNNDFTLVLFADNLGKYPPNTGLLVVHDGEDIYHLRFSSDLQKSSGIVFKRKK